MTTAGGIRTNDTTVICNIPYLGKRQVRVMEDSPPALSVRRDVIDNNGLFNYTRENGPVLSPSDGTRIYLLDDEHRRVPMLNGYCKSGKRDRPIRGKQGGR